MTGIPACPSKMRKKPGTWTDELVRDELVGICAATGTFPSNSELEQLGRSDLANQITRRGGFVQWSNQMGYKRKPSDSDFGWHGERLCIEKLTKEGFLAEPTHEVRAPYDILVNKCIRVDVKSANYAEYGACRGWFYRIGKHSQSDFIMLYQVDTGDAYYIPWQVCPTTNVTISRDGGIYKDFKNNVELLREVVRTRTAETIASQSILKSR